MSHSIAITCIVLAASISPHAAGAQARPTVITDSTLRAELLRRVAADQGARGELTALLQQGGTPDSGVVHRLAVVDSANWTWLAGVIAHRGWPGRSTVGADRSPTPRTSTHDGPHSGSCRCVSTSASSTRPTRPPVGTLADLAVGGATRC